MKSNRCVVLATIAAAFACSAASAQDYPARPIRVIVPYAPGGTDLQLRIMAPAFQRILGQIGRAHV